ncbi:hypothetical protein QLX67_08500 [Balneolaceae bacterium ANBcel3]|nr:hypothetical protein [Balneolaceae bacterium ANBcel3]
MKKSILTLIYVLCITGLPGKSVHGMFFEPDPLFHEVMLNQAEKVMNAGSLKELRESAIRFEMISDQYSGHWYPEYYLAYTYAMMSITAHGNPEESDDWFGRYGDVDLHPFFEEAERAINRAGDKEGDPSEVIAMQAFIMMARLNADASLGQRIGGAMSDKLHRAIAENPKNPRPFMILAYLEFGTAHFFGEQPTGACQRIEQSLALFQEEANKMEETGKRSLIWWGEPMAIGLMNACPDR